MKEAREGVITLKAAPMSENETDDLDADDPEAVKLMIDFLYHSNYEAVSTSIPPEEANETASIPLEEANESSSPARQLAHKKQRQAYGSSMHSKKNEKAMLAPAGDCNTLMHAKIYALGESTASSL